MKYNCSPDKTLKLYSFRFYYCVNANLHVVPPVTFLFHGLFVLDDKQKEFLNKRGNNRPKFILLRKFILFNTLINKIYYCPKLIIYLIDPFMLNPVSPLLGLMLYVPPPACSVVGGTVVVV